MKQSEKIEKAIRTAIQNTDARGIENNIVKGRYMLKEISRQAALYGLREEYLKKIYRGLI